ncbi:MULTISPECIES: class II glutamine amidotransferase [Legionella]|uniref:Class II glutamine amidotransferase n=1 Tax=Legionella septentrionalis TaxID=2498109 RepID=A0A3S1CKE4_9GAMM|nr:MULTISPECIES: class II glutamine amidotransferase [Legionella]MCP0914027.1 class II glutamine amidotransferase [Legionella sp. 27cVA30]RUQ81502.1 class II glutamine amidotransferase [Legionella septentrionalis]RUQ94600.1 class II glutamine amidotransferase [Legionella septentrionalis]RUR08667.1 class II glutamine amidotransferase [Legionella septentrionalis]RUR13039.1 class II glutamine amidotransferase [Legionella septentrionalis]
MCRILSYLGKPTLIEELLYKPDNSFIKQSYHPKYMSYLLNLAGFGMAAWEKNSHHPALPYLYKTPQLPFYDENLRNLASKISPHCFLAHLRGVSYHEKQVVASQNVHPFIYPETNIALAHNGVLYNFESMRYDLLRYIKEDYKKHIRGTTDSEWIYAVFLSQLAHPNGSYQPSEIINAIISTLKILKQVRYEQKIAINSPVNLFITNGEFIAATRFVLDYGWHPPGVGPSSHFTYHSLWYTYGESYGVYDGEYRMKGGAVNSSMIIASEPLTEDTTTWLEVPEYTLIFARQEHGEIKIISQDINI